jgi:HTH-type transcriptional regulator/antitoxin HigA
LVENYEQKHSPVAPANPVEAIKFRLEQMGASETELTKILGGRSRKSEILSGKRKLSLTMIRELHDKLNIPAETLIAEY